MCVSEATLKVKKPHFNTDKTQVFTQRLIMEHTQTQQLLTFEP